MKFDPELVEGILNFYFIVEKNKKQKKNVKLCNPLVDKESSSTEKGVKDESEGNRNNLAPWIRSKCI